MTLLQTFGHIVQIFQFKIQKFGTLTIANLAAAEADRRKKKMYTSINNDLAMSE
jgi:hypothetical protein